MKLITTPNRCCYSDAKQSDCNWAWFGLFAWTCFKIVVFSLSFPHPAGFDQIYSQFTCFLWHKWKLCERLCVQTGKHWHQYDRYMYLVFDRQILLFYKWQTIWSLISNLLLGLAHLNDRMNVRRSVRRRERARARVTITITKTASTEVARHNSSSLQPNRQIDEAYVNFTKKQPT